MLLLLLDENEAESSGAGMLLLFERPFPEVFFQCGVGGRTFDLFFFFVISMEMEDVTKKSVTQDYSKDDEELEREYFQKVIRAFLAYQHNVNMKIDKCKKDFAMIPVKHQKQLPDYLKKLDECKNCVEENQQLIKSIVMFTDHMFENADYAPEENPQKEQQIAKEGQEKVLTTLTQIVRDWAAEGSVEREASYGPILQTMKSMFQEEKRKDVYVLVPGTGLGRLMFEIAKLGFPCQGNEFSLYMLFASNYILNKTAGKNSVTFYPWVHQFCNVIKTSDQLRPVTFPDVDPRELPPDANFSVAAGDFLEIYTIKNSWNCIVTCFFIDTAHNIIAYVEKIHEILKPGGLWINHGPLLYHFADIVGDISIELSYEELRKIITNDYRFEFIKEELHSNSPYMQNPRSMLHMNYDCSFFVARKS